MKKYIYIILSIFLFLLTGCYVPEKFVAKVDVHKDGSYTMTYEGTIIYELAIGKQLSVKDEKELANKAKKISRDPEVKNIEYLGKGRYRLSMIVNKHANQRGYIFGKDMPIIQVIPRKNNALQVFVKEMKPKDIYELRSKGIKIDGKLIVSVPYGMTVTGSNADKTPSVFGLYGDYEWDIKSFQKKINITIIPESSKTKDFSLNIMNKVKKFLGDDSNPPYLIEGTNCVDHHDGRNGAWLNEMYRRGGVLDSNGCLLNSDNLNKKSISKKAISDAENLSNAIEVNDEHKVRELLNQEYDPNMIGSPNIEPVICFSEGRPKILKLLLEYGANPNVLCFNQVTKETSSLLKNTIYWNEVASAKLLLKHGASLDSRSINRKTKSDSKYNSILEPLVHEHNAKDLLKIAKSDAMKSLLKQYISDTKISQVLPVQKNNKALEER